MAEIEKESLEKTGLRSDVVTLYQGGKYRFVYVSRNIPTSAWSSPPSSPSPSSAAIPTTSNTRATTSTSVSFALMKTTNPRN